jgi:hypothetical protein
VQLVVKSQILAGGRGLGTFKNGLKGGVHIVKRDEVEDIAGLWIFSNSTTLHHVRISVITVLVDVGHHLLHSISVFFLVLDSRVYGGVQFFCIIAPLSFLGKRSVGSLA